VSRRLMMPRPIPAAGQPAAVGQPAARDGVAQSRAYELELMRLRADLCALQSYASGLALRTLGPGEARQALWEIVKWIERRLT